MIARLWANKIIAGEKTFSQVPEKLKEKVKEILISEGNEKYINE